LAQRRAPQGHPPIHRGQEDVTHVGLLQGERPAPAPGPQPHEHRHGRHQCPARPDPWSRTRSNDAPVTFPSPTNPDRNTTATTATSAVTYTW
jgi:hypothetical protein